MFKNPRSDTNEGVEDEVTVTSELLHARAERSKKQKEKAASSEGSD